MDFYGTLGPACGSYDLIFALFRAGMTGVRLNLSHTGLDQAACLLEEQYFPAARAAGAAHPMLIIDLQGPELRVGHLDTPVDLIQGETITLGGDGIPLPQSVISAAQTGDQISLDDSTLLVEVTAAQSEYIKARVVRGGRLSSRKSMALLGREVDSPALTHQDLHDLELAGRLGVTHILQPFVRGKEDVIILRETLRRRGLDHIRIMAKIENQRGLDHLDEIIAAADEVCIARGDLGNSMPLWQLPAVQKDIAARCVAAARPHCLVTQLLWSMEQRPVPTRAEVADIYNGVLDGCSSLMLTGETAAGRYPVEAMTYLVKTARSAMEHMGC